MARKAAEIIDHSYALEINIQAPKMTGSKTAAIVIIQNGLCGAKNHSAHVVFDLPNYPHEY